MKANTTIAEVIRSGIKKNKISQRTLSYVSGVDYNTLNKICTGVTINPSIEVVVKIFHHLHLNLDTLRFIYIDIPTTFANIEFGKDIAYYNSSWKNEYASYYGESALPGVE